MKFTQHPTYPLTRVSGAYSIEKHRSRLGLLWRLYFDGAPLAQSKTLAGAIAYADEHAGRSTLRRLCTPVEIGQAADLLAEVFDPWPPGDDK